MPQAKLQKENWKIRNGVSCCMLVDDRLRAKVASTQSVDFKVNPSTAKTSEAQKLQHEHFSTPQCLCLRQSVKGRHHQMVHMFRQALVAARPNPESQVHISLSLLLMKGHLVCDTKTTNQPDTCAGKLSWWCQKAGPVPVRGLWLES